MPKFSVVFASLDPDSEASLWLREQESDQVEVIIAQLQPSADCSSLLNQALATASGDYVALVDESLHVSVPHWLELLQTHIECSPYQILVLSGYEQILQQESVAHTTIKVAAPVASVGGRGIRTYGGNRFLRDAHVKEVVIIDGRCMFARRTLFVENPIVESGQASLAHTLFHYQVRLSLELGKAQGVLLGLSHEIADGSPWSNPAMMNACWDERFRHLLPLDSLQLSIWRLNLQALRAFDASAADQLLFLVSRDKGPRFQYRDHNRVTAVDGNQIALIVDHFNEVERLPDGDTFILCGAGTGLLIQQMLNHPRNEVLLVEPEYGLICELLKYYDWSDALSEGRLRIMPLATGSHELDEITATQTTRLLQIALDRSGRMTSVVRGYSYHLNTSWFRRIEQGLQQFMSQKTQAGTWLGQRRQVYDVTVVSPKCAIFQNLAQCFNDLGLRTRLFNVPDKPDQLAVDQIQNLLMQLAVDGSRLTICRNRSFFETENVRKAVSMERYLPGRLVNWWWDMPNVASFIDFNDPTGNAENIGFAVDMLNLLPKGSHWLPPAARVSFCRERLSDTPIRYDVCFVGQSRIPLIFGNLQAIVKFLQVQCGSVPGRLVRALLKPESFRQLHADICGLEAEFESLLNDVSHVAPAHVYFFHYLFNMAKTGAFRVAAIETLFANGIAVDVFGDQSWLSSGVVPEERFHGLVAPADLPALYQSARVNLNLNFMQVSSTVNPKVFDVLACDGAVLTDYRPEMEALFPDPELAPLAFNSLDDLVPMVEKALKISGIERWRAAGNAVRTRHTLLHRARWLAESYLPG